MKKGITIVALSTIIAVTIILATVVVISGSRIMESVNKTRFVAELLDIQDAIQSFKSSHGYYPENGMVQVDISGVSDATQFSREKVVSNKINLYLINYPLIGITDRVYGNNENGNIKDTYAFSEETGIVYYIQGIKYKGKTYYTATDEITDMSNITTNLGKNEIKKLDVIFEVSEIGFTKIPVSMKIKLPQDVTDIEITTTNGVKFDMTSTSENGYIIRNVNKVGVDQESTNYDITVKYKINNIEKEVKYSVQNFDNTAPTIDTNNVKGYNITVGTDESTSKRYLTLINVVDDLSGVKQIKYELENIADTNIKYFTTYGNILNDTKIDITGKDYCTIYAIDNAGNESILQIDLNNISY